MKFKWHLLIAAALIVIGLTVWAETMNGSISANTDLTPGGFKIHIGVDIIGPGAIVGLIALLLGILLMAAAVARAFLRHEN